MMDVEVTAEMIEAVDAYQKAENKRLADEYSRQARERWERIEREYREKARAVIPGMTEAQFNLLNTIFRDYHWEW
jgi:hypothetical protein